MTIKRWAAKRDEAELPIIQALKANGCKVEQMDEPCDLLVKRRDGRVFIIEVERLRPKTRSVKQLKFLGEWNVPRVSTPNEALQAIGAIK